MRLSNHTEFIALCKSLPGGAPVHQGSVPDSPTFPYVLINKVPSSASERSLNRTVHARTTRWKLTIAGENDSSVGIVIDQLVTALEGARINGQRLEEIPSLMGIEEDQDVTLPNNRHPQFAKQEWRVMH